MNWGQTLRQTWSARSTRERGLLLVLAVIAGGITAWYGVVLPLRTAAAAAEARHARAAADLEAVREATNRLAAFPKTSGGETIDAILSRTAEEAGMTIERHRVERPGVVTVWINGADPAALFPWLYGLQQRHGASLNNMAATRDGQGTLQVEAVVAGAGA